MTQERTSRRNIRRAAGTVLFLIGSTVLVGYSAGLLWQFQMAMDGTTLDSLGFFGSVGLASLRLVRIVALDHALLFSALLRILVLCSALVMTLIGIGLLSKRGKGAMLPGKGDAPVLPKGDQ